MKRIFVWNRSYKMNRTPSFDRASQTESPKVAQYRKIIEGAIMRNSLERIDLSLLEKAFQDIEKIDGNSKIFGYLAESCAYKAIHHPEWSRLAGILAILEIKANPRTGTSFSDTTEKAKLLLHPQYYEFVITHADVLDAMIVEERDDLFDWFGVATATRTYLTKVNKTTIETPQQMFLRVATWIWMPNIQKIEWCYNRLSLHRYIHATPTLINSGMRRPALSSCFLMSVKDNIESINDSWKNSSAISKNSGGIGIDISDIRHSEIGNTIDSSGIVPMLKVTNAILAYVDQMGKRKGSAAIYLPDYHIDIFEFLELRKPTGVDKMRARDLFYALWMSDLFMKRVENNEKWSLFCPNIAKGLNDVWGKEFEDLYTKYENEGKAARTINARDLWFAIYIAQVELGQPYVLYKDAVNRKNNQANLGTIRSSNLCCEICEYTSADEIASCNLANVVLTSCLVQNPDGRYWFDYDFLEELVRELVRNLNRVIDINYYPDDVPQIKRSNLKHRPIGIGVQGFADVLATLDKEWNSEDARRVNREIFETIYFAAVDESVQIVVERKIEMSNKREELRQRWKFLLNESDYEEKQKDAQNILKELKELENYETTYPSFPGSPASKGFLQFDLWDLEDIRKSNPELQDIDLDYVVNHSRTKLSGRYDWNRIRRGLLEHGMRNSLLVALMPTASTAHFMGKNESIETFGGLIEAATVLSGQYIRMNPYLVQDFINFFGKWTEEMAYDIIQDEGSIQSLDPRKYFSREMSKDEIERFDFLKKKYLTAYEISQKITADMALERGRFVCQAQSFNCFMKQPSYQAMTSFLFYQWKNGQKTGMYYLRSKPATSAIKFALNGKTKDRKADECVMCQ